MDELEEILERSGIGDISIGTAKKLILDLFSSKESDLVWVVENINGDVIGVADSFAKALLIYEQRYQDTPDRTEDRIHRFRLNELYYA